jgi:hypothetical protein
LLQPQLSIATPGDHINICYFVVISGLNSNPSFFPPNNNSCHERSIEDKLKEKNRLNFNGGNEKIKTTESNVLIQTGCSSALEY